ncbi:YER158C [Saccharomyces arboricola H-6]|uniref:YER158C n=1 Tax=Saccharomyces arboricola (strain H-6 / AS 2.3317 / CBS 10644) TaxID=1160507 RepID=J8PP87_SACAR|nr:YER158C [Saccharomyces arboricola H-6]
MIQQRSSSRRSFHGNDFRTLTPSSRRDSLNIPRAVDVRSSSTIDLFCIPDATVSRRHSSLVALRPDNNASNTRAAPMRHYNKCNFASSSTSSLPTAKNRPPRYENMSNDSMMDYNIHPQINYRPNSSRRHSLMTIPEKYSGSRPSLRSSPPTYSNPRLRKELTPFQLQRKQMKTAFQFPNGENFTPRKQIPRSSPPSSTLLDSPPASSVPLTAVPRPSLIDNRPITAPVTCQPLKITNANGYASKPEIESPKSIKSNSKKISSFFRKIWSSKSSNSTDSTEENNKTKQKRKNPGRVVPEPITSLEQPVEIERGCPSTVTNQETFLPPIKDFDLVQEFTALGDSQIPVLPPPRSPNRPTLLDKRTTKLYYGIRDPSNKDIAPEENADIFLKRLRDEWSTVYLNKLPLTASIPSSLSTTVYTASPSSVNSSVSSPVPSSSSSSSSLVSRCPGQSMSSSSPTPVPSSGSSKSKNTSKSLRFANEIYVNDTWSPVDYCRCDNTFLDNFSKVKSQDISNSSTLIGNNLSSTKNISNIEIKMEVNEFKKREMRVHQDSARYTHYYL